jgi:hypothetical protein
VWDAAGLLANDNYSTDRAADRLVGFPHKSNGWIILIVILKKLGIRTCTGCKWTKERSSTIEQ